MEIFSSPHLRMFWTCAGKIFSRIRSKKCISCAVSSSENPCISSLSIPLRRSFTLWLCALPLSGSSVLLTDTVGFIRNLPHHFVKAFKSTLDEVKYADIIIMLMDASDSECVSQAEVTQELLNQLGAENKPILYVFNKCDEAEKAEGGFIIPVIEGAEAENVFCISAKTGKGVDALVEKIDVLRAEMGKF